MKHFRTGLPALCLTLMFLAFCGGYLLGANSSGEELQLAMTNPTLTTAAQAHTDSTSSKQTVSPSTSAPTQPTAPIKLDLNTANVDELSSLPGIGPVIAQRIVDYRNEHGAFSALKDLDNVKGIGEARIAELQDYVFVEGRHEDTGG